MTGTLSEYFEVSFSIVLFYENPQHPVSFPYGNTVMSYVQNRVMNVGSQVTLFTEFGSGARLRPHSSDCTRICR